MTTVTPVVPSGSTDGATISVAATTSPGTLFHTADASAKDEVWMWLGNSTGSDIVATVEIGGTSNPTKITVPANDSVLALAGPRLTNSKTVKVFASAGLVMYGNVNRIA